MFLMFSSRHVKGEYQQLLKMFPVFAENGGIHHAWHFFKNSDLDLYTYLFFVSFVKLSIDMFFSFLLFSVLSDSKNAEILHLSQFESEFHV